MAVSVGDFRDKLGNETTAGRMNPVKMARPPLTVEIKIARAVIARVRP